MDFLSAEALPWLRETQRRLRATRQAGRLPQSLLLLSVPGLGAELLANWIAALALCESRDAPASDFPASGSPAPCGVCASCVLLRADTHPDAHIVRLIDDAQQIKVDQIRELIESLALSSYRGGYKVAILENAEALNANGANAFLKTLEEPTSRTLLILIAKPSHRLPATIASRCVKVTLRPPAKPAAVAWLAERDPSVGEWDAALALAGGAPLLALELPAAGIARLDQDMRRSLDLLRDKAVDVTVLADAWVKSDSALRLRRHFRSKWGTGPLVCGFT
jgi:DNA polymerase-3 subunit delta'